MTLAATFMALLCVYQSAWLADHSLVKVWEKSRRIGASWVEALYTVLIAAKNKNAGGQNSYYLSYNKEMTRQFIKDCMWWAKVLHVACGDVEELVTDFDKDITFFRIRFASGNEVEALPSEARSLRSKQGRVIIDEAAFVDDLEALLKAAMALLMWGGQVVILSTHNGVENPFNELISDVRAGKRPYILHRTNFDQALKGGLFQAICRKTGKEWSQEAQDAWRAEQIAKYGDVADEELFCIPSRSGGVWLTGALIEGCMQPDLPVIAWSPEIMRAYFDTIAKQVQERTLESEPAEAIAAAGVQAVRGMLRSREFVDVPIEIAAALVDLWALEHLIPLIIHQPQHRHFIGGDFGRVGDLTVFWPLAETAHLHCHTPFTLELRDTPFRVQQQLLFLLGSLLPRFSGTALDARGIGMQLAEAARQKWGPSMVAQIMLTEGWYREHMPAVKADLEDKTTTLPKHADVKDDFRLIRIINGVPRVPDTRTGEKGKKRHGDSAIAYALARYALKNLTPDEPFMCISGAPLSASTLPAGF